jgi:hypothetical protein
MRVGKNLTTASFSSDSLDTRGLSENHRGGKTGRPGELRPHDFRVSLGHESVSGG